MAKFSDAHGGNESACCPLVKIILTAEPGMAARLMQAVYGQDHLDRGLIKVRYNSMTWLKQGRLKDLPDSAANKPT